MERIELKMPAEIKVDPAEVMRYMRLCGGDVEIEKRVRELIPEVSRSFLPKAAAMKAVVRAEPDGVRMEHLMLGGQALKKHLEGCREAVLFAATIGPGADREIARRSAGSALDGWIADCVCTAAAERLCDEICAQLPPKQRSRFSPGYGDLPMDCQGEILTALGAMKYAGIALTQGMMMVPAKSVTAIVGLITE